jgi:hypothetical protein
MLPKDRVAMIYGLGTSPEDLSAAALGQRLNMTRMVRADRRDDHSPPGLRELNLVVANRRLSHGLGISHSKHGPVRSSGINFCTEGFAQKVTCN